MEIREYVPLKDFTTFRLGGPARFFVSVTTIEELRNALLYAREHHLAVHVLGGGSNTLCTDNGYDGLVIHIALTGVAYEEDSKGDARVTAAAGVVWDTLVEDTVSQGLWGMENLSHIPGTVGATPVQNVGAYGVEVSDIIDWVEVIDSTTGVLHILSPNECRFAYRGSVFKHAEGRHYIVTRVAYRLSTHPAPKLSYRDLAVRFEQQQTVTVQEVRDAIIAIRAAKFPNLDTIGTAGSFFKNPVVTKRQYEELVRRMGTVPSYEVDEEHVKIPLGWLLEKFGWKGKRVGQVGCWEAQALVVVQYGEASANELLLFVYDIMKDIQKNTGIKIEPEVCIIGT